MIYIDISTRTKKWSEEKEIETFIEETCKKLILLTDLRKILSEDFELELSVILVSDPQIRKINSQFRDKSKATNVLSFPSLDENLIREIGLQKTLEDIKPHQYLMLGDIIISYQTLVKESLAQKKKFRDHLTHLILHSLLHLIGFNHEDDKMAEEMENLEIKILKKIGITNPYINN